MFELVDIIKKATEIKESTMKPRLVKEIVPIEKWLENEYYVGPVGMYLYPYWKKQMIKIFKDSNTVNEVIVTGGIGTGKSTFAIFCMIRKLYELSCYVNIPTLFGLMPSSMIAFMYFSVNKLQAELTGYGQYRSTLDDIPYFKEEFCRDKNIDSMLRFPENVLYLSGSTTNHAIGMNMIGSILDEANFFKQGNNSINKSLEDFSKVANLYTSIINRAKSRFLRRGVDYSLSILVSSNSTETSFTEQRLKQTRGSKTTLEINARVWDVKPPGTYSDEMFFVFIGSDLIDPMIVNDETDLKQVVESMNIEIEYNNNLKNTIEKLPGHIKELIIDVPIDFKKQFEDNIINSLQDIAGMSVAPAGRLFSSKKLYLEACDNELRHPFTKEMLIIATQDDIKPQDYIDKNYKPQKIEKKRYIHIDQSLKNDSTGFASAYISDYILEGETVKPIITVDIQLKINPPKSPRQISIPKIRDFIFFLKNNYNLDIGYVSYDWYGSQESLQILEENNIQAGTQSVDRSDEAYLTFVNLLYEGRIRMYNYPETERELFELIHDRTKRKVDHPVNGSKDIMDAVVGAVFNAIKFSEGEVKTDVSGLLGDILGETEEDIFSMDELLF